MKRKYRKVSYKTDLAQIAMQKRKDGFDIAMRYGEIMKYMIYISLNREFGFGAKRLEKLDRILCEKLRETAKDSDADPFYMLDTLQKQYDEVIKKSPSDGNPKKGTNKTNQLDYITTEEKVK